MQQPIRVLLFVIIALLLSAGIVGAQDGQNLLRDGEFEGSYSGRGSGTLNIPGDWQLWVAEPSGQFTNQRPTAYPHNGPDPDPKSGTRALNFSGGFVTYTVAVYQQVSVPEGSIVRGSAFGWLHTCLVPKDNQKCNSNGEMGAYIKVGVDPNGGTNPNDSNIVWSGQAQPHDRWEEISVSATATSGTVTFFIYASQQRVLSLSDEHEPEGYLNKVYFDDARLVVTGQGTPGGSSGGGGGGGSQAAAPPPPSSVGFVSPQDERDDGSIVHVVQSGDTIDSIAVAYDTTRLDIMELNGISDPRIIQIGQELIIREGEGQGDEGDSSEENGDGEPSDAEGDENTDDENPEADGESSEDDGDGGEDRESVDPAEAPPAPVVSVASGNVLPARDPAALTASICVLVFNDANQNRIQEEGEGLVADGAIEVRAGGEEVEDYDTDGASEPHCFTDLAAGEYVTVAQPPSGYGLTTPNQFRVQANPGATIHLAFGAAEGVVPPMVPPPDDLIVVNDIVEEPETPRNPLRDNLGLIVFGLAGVVLVVGTGATVLMRRR